MPCLVGITGSLLYFCKGSGGGEELLGIGKSGWRETSWDVIYEKKNLKMKKRKYFYLNKIVV